MQHLWSLYRTCFTKRDPFFIKNKRRKESCEFWCVGASEFYVVRAFVVHVKQETIGSAFIYVYIHIIHTHPYKCICTAGCCYRHDCYIYGYTATVAIEPSLTHVHHSNAYKPEEKKISSMVSGHSRRVCARQRRKQIEPYVVTSHWM